MRLNKNRLLLTTFLSFCLCNVEAMDLPEKKEDLEKLCTNTLEHPPLSPEHEISSRENKEEEYRALVEQNRIKEAIDLLVSSEIGATDFIKSKLIEIRSSPGYLNPKRALQTDFGVILKTVELEHSSKCYTYYCLKYKSVKKTTQVENTKVTGELIISLWMAARLGNPGAKQEVKRLQRLKSYKDDSVRKQPHTNNLDDNLAKQLHAFENVQAHIIVTYQPEEEKQPQKDGAKQERLIQPAIHEQKKGSKKTRRIEGQSENSKSQKENSIQDLKAKSSATQDEIQTLFPKEALNVEHEILPTLTILPPAPQVSIEALQSVQEPQTFPHNFNDLLLLNLQGDVRDLPDISIDPDDTVAIETPKTKVRKTLSPDRDLVSPRKKKNLETVLPPASPSSVPSDTKVRRSLSRRNTVSQLTTQEDSQKKTLRRTESSGDLSASKKEKKQKQKPLSSSMNPREFLQRKKSLSQIERRNSSTDLSQRAPAGEEDYSSSEKSDAEGASAEGLFNPNGVKDKDLGRLKKLLDDRTLIKPSDIKLTRSVVVRSLRELGPTGKNIISWNFETNGNKKEDKITASLLGNQKVKLCIHLHSRTGKWYEDENIIDHYLDFMRKCDASVDDLIVQIETKKKRKKMKMEERRQRTKELEDATPQKKETGLEASRPQKQDRKLSKK